MTTLLNEEAAPELAPTALDPAEFPTAEPNSAITGADFARVAATIEACRECLRHCTARAESCLEQAEFGGLARCATAALDCADICQTIIWALSRYDQQDSGLLRNLLQACAAACRTCQGVCNSLHVDLHQHRRACDRAAERCEQACNHLLLALAIASVAVTSFAADSSPISCF